MVDDLAFRVDAAQPGARVATLLVNAGLVVGAVGVGDALRPAPVLRVTDIVADARAHRLLALHAAIGVDATRRRHARVGRQRRLLFGRDDLRLLLAPDVRVAHEAGGAEADRSVGVDLTQRVDAAGSRARVHALGVDAGQVVAAFRVDSALRFTALEGVRFAEEAGGAGADGVVAGRHRALRVGPARGRLARVVGLSFALHLRVASIAVEAATVQLLASHVALCVLTTDAGAAARRRHCRTGIT